MVFDVTFLSLISERSQVFGSVEMITGVQITKENISRACELKQEIYQQRNTNSINAKLIYWEAITYLL